jgi:hypothetical protein
MPEDAEHLDITTMLEVTKVVDRLERVVFRLKGLGSNLSVIEPPSLDVLERLPRGTGFFEPGSSPFGPPRHIRIEMDLEESRDECDYCRLRLDKILNEWNQRGSDE